MIIAVVKKHLRKLSPKVINYSDFRKWIPYNLLSEKKLLIIAKNIDKYFEIYYTVLNTRACKMKDIYAGVISYQLSVISYFLKSYHAKNTFQNQIFKKSYLLEAFDHIMLIKV